MDFKESDEQTMLRSTVREIASGFGHSYFVEQTRSGSKTDELWASMADQGFLGVHLPGEYGGGDAGIYELAIVCEEAAAQGCPLLLILVSAAISAELIARFGTVQQKSSWLPGLVQGAKMAFAITEPDAGSNSHSISTTAVRDGDVYRLSGAKTFISGVDESDRILVVTRTGVDESTGRARLSLFVVDADATGLVRQQIPVEMAIPEKQFSLFFDNVEVPADRMLGGEHEGLRVVFQGLNPERITGASVAVGIGRYALAKASEYARERRVWDTPIGMHQGISHPMAEAKVELELARLMMAKAAWSTITIRRVPRPGRPPTWPVRCCRRRAPMPRRGHPDAWGQRHDVRIRIGGPLGDHSTSADRPRESRNDLKLRGQPLARATQKLLMRPESWRERLECDPASPLAQSRRKRPAGTQRS